jgi:CheY-like chemotaxis protein
MQGQPAPDKGSVLVLVVESAPYIRALQQSLLGERHTVHFVADGELALEPARRLLPRLLIADILVPQGISAPGHPGPARRSTASAEQISTGVAGLDRMFSAHDSWIRQMTIGTAGIEVDGAPPKAGG